MGFTRTLSRAQAQGKGERGVGGRVAGGRERERKKKVHSHLS